MFSPLPCLCKQLVVDCLSVLGLANACSEQWHLPIQGEIQSLWRGREREEEEEEREKQVVISVKDSQNTLIPTTKRNKNYTTYNYMHVPRAQSLAL